MAQLELIFPVSAFQFQKRVSLHLFFSYCFYSDPFLGPLICLQNVLGLSKNFIDSTWLLKPERFTRLLIPSVTLGELRVLVVGYSLICGVLYWLGLFR